MDTPRINLSRSLESTASASSIVNCRFHPSGIGRDFLCSNGILAWFGSHTCPTRHVHKRAGHRYGRSLVPSWCRIITKHCWLTFIVGTDAQNLSALVSTDCSLSLDGHLNTPSVPSLRNLRAYPRNQTYETLQEYTAEPVLIGGSFFRECLSSKPETDDRRPNNLRIVVPNRLDHDVERDVSSPRIPDASNINDD